MQIIKYYGILFDLNYLTEENCLRRCRCTQRLLNGVKGWTLLSKLLSLFQFRSYFIGWWQRLLGYKVVTDVYVFAHGLEVHMAFILSVKCHQNKDWVRKQSQFCMSEGSKKVSHFLFYGFIYRLLFCLVTQSNNLLEEDNVYVHTVIKLSTTWSLVRGGL